MKAQAKYLKILLFLINQYNLKILSVFVINFFFVFEQYLKVMQPNYLKQ